MLMSAAMLCLAVTGYADSMSRTTLKDMLDNKGRSVPESDVARAYIRAYVEQEEKAFRVMALMRNKVDAAEIAWSECEAHFDVDTVVRAFRKSLPPMRETSQTNRFGFWFSIYSTECRPVSDLRTSWYDEDKKRFGEADP